MPDVDRLEQREVLRARLHEVGKAEQHGLALARRRAAPAPGLERPAAGAHRAVDVLGAAPGHLGDPPAVARLVSAKVSPLAAGTKAPSRNASPRGRTASAAARQACGHPVRGDWAIALLVEPAPRPGRWAPAGSRRRRCRPARRA